MSAMPAKLFVGTSGWNYSDWRERFYPADVKPRQYLTHYATRFHTTEVNYSFYHLPKRSTYENWAAQVPPDFVFALKASRTITHIRRLRDVAELWREFLENASALNDRLGPVLLQFPPSFKKDAQLLAAFLAESSRLDNFGRRRLAFEFRHESWFAAEVYEVLRQHGSALVIAHSERYPQAPFVQTARFVYLRLHGPGALFASAYSEKQLRDWAAEIVKWMNAEKGVHVYFNNDFQGYAIENAVTLSGLIDVLQASSRRATAS